MITQKQLDELKEDQDIEIEPRKGGNQFPGATFKKVDGENVLFMAHGNGQTVPKHIFMKYCVIPGVSDTDTDADTTANTDADTGVDTEKANDSADTDTNTDADTKEKKTAGRKRKNS